MSKASTSTSIDSAKAAEADCNRIERVIDDRSELVFGDWLAGAEPVPAPWPAAKRFSAVGSNQVSRKKIDQIFDRFETDLNLVVPFCSLLKRLVRETLFANTEGFFFFFASEVAMHLDRSAGNRSHDFKEACDLRKKHRSFGFWSEKAYETLLKLCRWFYYPAPELYSVHAVRLFNRQSDDQGKELEQRFLIGAVGQDSAEQDAQLKKVYSSGLFPGRHMEPDPQGHLFSPQPTLHIVRISPDPNGGYQAARLIFNFQIDENRSAKIAFIEETHFEPIRRFTRRSDLTASLSQLASLCDPGSTCLANENGGNLNCMAETAHRDAQKQAIDTQGQQLRERRFKTKISVNEKVLELCDSLYGCEREYAMSGRFEKGILIKAINEMKSLKGASRSCKEMFVRTANRLFDLFDIYLSVGSEGLSARLQLGGASASIQHSSIRHRRDPVTQFAFRDTPTKLTK